MEQMGGSVRKRKTRILETGISPDYTSDWTVIEAIRECIQNWIDVRAEYDAKGSITWKDGMAILKDFGPGMGMRHLAIGISEKGERSIGQFGEGLKLALLVLAREGRAIQIRTNGHIIEPEIGYSKAYETDVLRFRVTQMEARHTAIHIGTSMRVECSREELRAGRKFFIQFASRSPKFRWLERGHLSREDEEGGYVFVNGARVAKIEDALFNHHLEGPEASKALNRDRNTVDAAIIRKLAALSLRETSSREVMETVILDVTRGGRSWEAELPMPWGLHKDRARLWKRAWNKVTSDKAVLSSEAVINAQASYRGFQVVEVPYRWVAFLRNAGVPTAADAINVSTLRQKWGRILLKDLTPGEREILAWSKRVCRRVMGELPAIVIADNLEGLGAGAPGAEFAGVYDPGSDRVFLRRLILIDRFRTLHTLLHELVHRSSKAADLTPKFQDALLDVAVELLIVPPDDGV